MSDNRLTINRDYCDGVGDGLRYAYGGTDQYYPSQWENAIKGLKKTLQAKTATPGTSQQVIEPDSGYDGLTSVTVSGDADLVAGNIKKDVEIFGVTGTFEGGGGNITVEPITINQDGVYTAPTGKAYSPVTVMVSGGGTELVPMAVGASSTYSSSPKQPAMAFGDVEGNFWGSGGRNNYLSVTPAQPIAFNKVRLSNYYRVSSSTYWYSSAITVRASNDGFSTYDDLYVGTGLAQSETQIELNLNNTTAYKEYRFICSDSSAYVGLGRIEIQTVSGGGETLTYLKVGQSNIIVGIKDSEYGAMSNYSYDYLVPCAQDGTETKLDLSQPFEICCKFKLATAPGTGGRNIWGSSNSYYHCPSMNVYNSKIVYYVTTNGSSWQYNAVSITPSGYSFPVNTDVIAKLTWDGTDFTFYVNDGTNEYTATLEGIIPYYNSNYHFEFGGQNKSQYSIAACDATIQLNGTYLKQGSTIIWGSAE